MLKFTKITQAGLNYVSCQVLLEKPNADWWEATRHFYFLAGGVLLWYHRSPWLIWHNIAFMFVLKEKTKQRAHWNLEKMSNWRTVIQQGHENNKKSFINKYWEDIRFNWQNSSLYTLRKIKIIRTQSMNTKQLFRKGSKHTLKLDGKIHIICSSSLISAKAR